MAISTTMSDLFAQISSIENAEVRRHLEAAQDCFEKADKYGSSIWNHLAHSDLNSALHEIRLSISAQQHATKIAEIRKQRKLNKNAHKRSMKTICNKFTNGKSVDYSSGIVLQESWFDAAPSQQETDLVDVFKAKYDHTKVWSTGKCQAKNKSKWARSGRQARVLSNR